MRTTTIRTPISANQLTLLRDVFDAACDRHGIRKDSKDGEALAVILVHSLQKGVRDREKLISLAEVLTTDR